MARVKVNVGPSYLHEADQQLREARKLVEALMNAKYNERPLLYDKVEGNPLAYSIYLEEMDSHYKEER